MRNQLACIREMLPRHDREKPEHNGIKRAHDGNDEASNFVVFDKVLFAKTAMKISLHASYQDEARPHSKSK